MLPDKRILRKIASSFPKVKEENVIYFTTASAGRERLLLFYCYKNSVPLSVGFLSKQQKEMIILNFENNRWYKNIPMSMRENSLLHINTKAARNYLNLIDEKVNILQYIDKMISNERYSKTIEKSEMTTKKDNRLISAVLKKIPKRANLFGKKILGDVLLYSGKKVYCTKCETWHTFSLRPKNGGEYTCPSCGHTLKAKPLIGSLKNDKCCFYVMINHKGLLFILHCCYSRYLDLSTNKVLCKLFPFWIDIFDPEKMSLKKYRWDFSDKYVRGRGIRFSTWQKDYRYDPAPLYTGNVKNVIKNTFLKSSGIDKLDGVVYLDKLLILMCRYPNEFEFLIKGGYKNLLIECICYPSTLKKLKTLPKSVFNRDNLLWYEDYNAINNSNGRLTPADCRKFNSIMELNDIVDCVLMTNSLGNKIISYVEEKKKSIRYYLDYLNAVCNVLESATVPKKLKFPNDLTVAHDEYISRRKIKHNKQLNEKLMEKMKNYPEKITFENYNFYFAHSYKFRFVC